MNTIKLLVTAVQRQVFDFYFGQGEHDVMFYGNDVARWETDGGKISADEEI